MPRRTASVTALPTAILSAEPLALPARFLTPEDVAALFGVPLETVYQWRRKRTGPPGFRAARSPTSGASPGSRSPAPASLKLC